MDHVNQPERNAEESRLDWQLSFLPGDQGQPAPFTQRTMFEIGPALKRRRDLPGQRHLFEGDIPMGPQGDTQEETSHG